MSDKFEIPNFATEEEEAAWWPTQEDALADKLESRITKCDYMRFDMDEVATWAVIPLSATDRDTAQQLAEQANVSYDDCLEALVHDTLRDRMKLIA